MIGMNAVSRATRSIGFASAQQARNFGANDKAIQQRMKSVKNIQKVFY